MLSQQKRGPWAKNSHEIIPFTYSPRRNFIWVQNSIDRFSTIPTYNASNHSESIGKIVFVYWILKESADKNIKSHNHAY